MSRLINADALLSKGQFVVRMNDFGEYFVTVEEINKMPTVDAVQVVRCGECKHRYVDGDNVRYNVCELNHNKVQADDWFCADGERGSDD